jgi:HD-like signal output (HDOD) protein
MAALCHPEVSATQVAALMAEEPSLYARVLRVANSAYYGQARSIGTVERALVLLGLEAVCGIAAAACLDRTLARAAKDELVNMEALMRHSHATAVAAGALARISQPELASEAFIAGLLHNLGIVVQIHLDTPGIEAMIDLRRNNDTRDIRELESARAAVSHEECAAAVCEAWQLPESLIAATSHHHDPMMAPEEHRKLAALVNLGATLGLAVGSTYALEPGPVERNACAMSILGLSGDQLDKIAVLLPERVGQLSAALLGP